jgi:hypothetical protein
MGLHIYLTGLLTSPFFIHAQLPSQNDPLTFYHEILANNLFHSTVVLLNRLAILPCVTRRILRFGPGVPTGMPANSFTVTALRCTTATTKIRYRSAAFVKY